MYTLAARTTVMRRRRMIPTTGLRARRSDRMDGHPAGIGGEKRGKGGPRGPSCAFLCRGPARQLDLRAVGPEQEERERARGGEYAATGDPEGDHADHGST